MLLELVLLAPTPAATIVGKLAMFIEELVGIAKIGFRLPHDDLAT